LNFEQKSNKHERRLAILAQIHHKIGLLMGATNNIDEEIIQFKKAIVLCEASKSIDLLGICHMTLAYAYLHNHKSDLALTEFKTQNRFINRVSF
jgi:hypothetical protein